MHDDARKDPSLLYLQMSRLILLTQEKQLRLKTLSDPPFYVFTLELFSLLLHCGIAHRVVAIGP